MQNPRVPRGGQISAFCSFVSKCGPVLLPRWCAGGGGLSRRCDINAAEVRARATGCKFGLSQKAYGSAIFAWGARAGQPRATRGSANRGRQGARSGPLGPGPGLWAWGLGPGPADSCLTRPGPKPGAQGPLTTNGFLSHFATYCNSFHSQKSKLQNIIFILLHKPF